MLRVKLPHLDGWAEGRRQNAARYVELFAQAGLNGVVTLPAASADCHHVYNQFVIRVPSRDRVRTELGAAGIGTEVYYPVPFHLQKCFAGLGYQPGAFPVAESAARESLAIPVFPEMTAEQQERVVTALATSLAGAPV